MFETKVTYLSQQRKTYVTPWIHVRNVELRGGMVMTSAGAGDTDPVIIPETDPQDPNAPSKSSDLFFSDPFASDFEIEY